MPLADIYLNPPPLIPGSAPDVKDKERVLSTHPGRVFCLAEQVNVKDHLPNGQGSRQVSHQLSH